MKSFFRCLDFRLLQMYRDILLFRVCIFFRVKLIEISINIGKVWIAQKIFKFNSIKRYFSEIFFKFYVKFWFTLYFFIMILWYFLIMRIISFFLRWLLKSFLVGTLLFLFADKILHQFLDYISTNSLWNLFVRHIRFYIKINKITHEIRNIRTRLRLLMLYLIANKCLFFFIMLCIELVNL